MEKIAIPSDAREINVEVQYNNNYVFFNFNLTKEQLTGSGKTYYQGYTMDSSHYGMCYITATYANVWLSNLYINGVSNTDTSKIVVYYK